MAAIVGAKPAEHIFFRVEELSDVSADKVAKATDILGIMANLKDPNLLYLRTFQLLKLGGLEAEIPRLVVFGQQSMGKTTLLDYIMGGPIGYSSTDTGTKQPVLIMLKPSESGEIECTFDGKDCDIRGLQEAMKERMSGAGETISAQELEVEIAVPGGVHAVFVDLPGIKDDSKTGADITRSVVRNYVQSNPHDLYMLVKKASDDPANWPWSLREFILTAHPKGLGLSPRQTIVVGTRAREFLLNEKNDVRTQKQLLERVEKRAVKDVNNNALPLFLLELFSLSIELKDMSSFLDKRDAMNSQVQAGRQGVLDLLSGAFEATTDLKKQQELLNYFDVNKFREVLNVKFQLILNDQLASLERRLVRKRLSTQERINNLEEQMSKHTSQSIRESIKLYLREFLETVTELVTGNYTIIRLPECGERFLKTFGGSLADNLAEGHQLAVELFPDKEQYDPEFLSKILYQTEQVFQQIDTENSSAETNTVNTVYNSGMLVRFLLSKDQTLLFGKVQESEGEEVVVTFFFRPIAGEDEAEGSDQMQDKTVDKERLTHINSVGEGIVVPKSGLKSYAKQYRKDGWVGLEPCTLYSIQNGRAKITIDDTKQDIKFSDVYIDESAKRVSSKHNLSTMQRVAGEFADSKLLNQLSMTHLGRWLKFHICNLEPDRRFSEDVLLQMMRSVRHVIDKADWEPLVADLLQANVRGGMLHVARLSACAAAAALRKILRAACAEVYRHVESGDVGVGLTFLATNPRFMEELETSLELYCRDKAMKCTKTMGDLIFEQTHAIHFEMIEDFFDGCKQFENDFLETNDMGEIAEKVRESLALRKRRLGVADVYSRHENTGTPNSMIYEEVRMQFWVIKMLLSAPLTTKLYMHFVKDIKDKTSHLASVNVTPTSCESDLEKNLQDKILCEKTPGGRYLPRTDDELMTYYDISVDNDTLRYKVAAAQRTEEYVRLALEGVSKLRQQIHREGGVDFLMRLNLAGD